LEKGLTVGIEVFIVLLVLLLLFGQRGGLDITSFNDPYAISKQHKEHELAKLRKKSSEKNASTRKKQKEAKIKRQLTEQAVRESGRQEAEKSMPGVFQNGGQSQVKKLSRLGFGFEGDGSKKWGDGADESGAKKGVFQPAGAVISGLGTEDRSAVEWTPANASGGSVTAGSARVGLPAVGFSGKLNRPL
jgi:hypothetical protein